jgi:YndJ-like protein
MLVAVRLGACVWLAAAAAAGADLLPWGIVEPLFLLAPLVLVPVAVPLVDDPCPGDLRVVLPVGSLAAAGALIVHRGPLAAALAIAWLAVTVRLAILGALRVVRRPPDAAEIAIDLGLMTLPIGGAWFVASRLGLEPMGFHEPIVLLTAVHFHYAAFAALLWTGCAARRLPASRPRLLAVTGVSVGTPLLAAGITLAPWLELLGALVLTASLGALAVRVLATAPRSRAGGLLVRISAVSVLVSMPLAVVYAWGQVATPLVSLAAMARLHGTTNALGFGLCGLLGWARITRDAGAS